MAEARSEPVVIARAGIARADADRIRARSNLRPQLSASASYDRALASEFEGVFGGTTTPTCSPFALNQQASIDARLAQIAFKQYGLVSRTQALAEGMSSNSIDRRVHEAIWQRVRIGVYRFAAVPVSWHQSLMAACLQIPGAAACGRERSNQARFDQRRAAGPGPRVDRSPLISRGIRRRCRDVMRSPVLGTRERRGAQAHRFRRRPGVECCSPVGSFSGSDPIRPRFASVEDE
jgi:hypothetical protein